MTEYWFWFALLSALAAGGESFIHKVVAMRDGDIRAFNTVSSLISTSALVAVTALAGGFTDPFTLASLLACAGAGTYLLTLVFKVEALKSLDSAVFFPLYKVSGPSLAILIGMLLFSETFTAREWLGLGLGLMVPLLLINRAEEHRQKNLPRGLLMLGMAAFTGAVSIALFKEGAIRAHNIWEYVLASEIFLFLCSALPLLGIHGAQTTNYILSQAGGRNLTLVLCMGTAQVISTSGIIFAFSSAGPLGIVYTINSIYIIVPIALSALFFREHLNVIKLVAIGLSVLTVALLG